VSSLTDYFGSCLVGFHEVVDDKQLELPRLQYLPVHLTPRLLGHHRQPHVELVDPVHESVDGDYDERGACVRVTNEDVYEWDDLDGLPETHAVSEDAAEAVARLEPVQRLNEIVVEKAYPSYLLDIISLYNIC